MKVLFAFILLYSLGASCHTKASTADLQPSYTEVDTCKTEKDSLTGRMIYRSAEKVAKSLKWFPGKCNGKNVPMLYRLPMIIDLRSE